MKKNVGTIKSKSTGFCYTVSHDEQSQTAWISRDNLTWRMVCDKVSEKHAVNYARTYIDGQPNLF